MLVLRKVGFGFSFNMKKALLEIYYFLTTKTLGSKITIVICLKLPLCVNGAEICEMVHLIISNNLGNAFGKKNIGLYRDDGLEIVKNRPANGK